MLRKPKQIIAVVLYPGMTALDVVGTMEAMIWLNANSPYRLVTVAARKEPIQTDTPLQMIPNRTFAELDRPFGLLIPGGDTALRVAQDADLRRYVQTAAETAGLVASVGTGSLILAAAGVLTGRQATTHWRYADQLADYGVRYVRQRWVDDGKFVTAAGVTAGIDLGLYLVGKLTTIGKARNAQLIIEYDPQPPHGGIDWDRIDQEHKIDSPVKAGNSVRPMRADELVATTSVMEAK
jgi:transcriptional regulator GlxA family with amidase domain